MLNCLAVNAASRHGELSGGGSDGSGSVAHLQRSYFADCKKLIILRESSVADRLDPLSCSSLVQLLSYVRELTSVSLQFACARFCDIGELLEAMFALCDSLEKLALYAPDLSDDHVAMISQRVKNLKKIDFWGARTTDKSLSSVAMAGSSLEKLAFGGFMYSTASLAFCESMVKCTALKTLNISRCYRVTENDLLALPQTIEKLNLNYCTGIRDCGPIAEHFVNLRELSMVQSSKDFIASTIPKLASLSNTLQHLNIRDIHVTNQDFILAVSALVNLRSLDITNCSRISPDAILETFGNGSRHSKLTYLKMEECYCIDDRVCTQVLSNMSLNTLIITIPRISDETAIQCFCGTTISKSLRHLEIAYSRQLTNRFVWSISASLMLEHFDFFGFSPKKVTEHCLLEFPRYQTRLQTLMMGPFREFSADAYETYIAPLSRITTLKSCSISSGNASFIWNKNGESRIDHV